MDINRYKKLLPFIASVVLFVIGGVFALFTVLSLDAPLENPESSVEVNLPVMNWGQYSNLSKKLDSVSIKPVK